MNLSEKAMFSYILSGCMFLISAFLYLEYIDGVGFPDGHKTAYKQAMEAFCNIAVFPMLLLGIYNIYLGSQSNKKPIGKPLSISFIIFIVFVLIIFLVDRHLYNTLDHGQGG